MFEISLKLEVKEEKILFIGVFYLVHRYFPFKVNLIISENFYSNKMQGVALKLLLI